MKKEDIKNIIREILAENEIGNKDDIDMATKNYVDPYFDLLYQVGLDWGKGSSIYNALENAWLNANKTFPEVGKLIKILKDYDVYNDYQHFLKLNENK